MGSSFITCVGAPPAGVLLGCPLCTGSPIRPPCSSSHTRMEVKVGVEGTVKHASSQLKGLETDIIDGSESECGKNNKALFLAEWCKNKVVCTFDHPDKQLAW